MKIPESFEHDGVVVEIECGDFSGTLNETTGEWVIYSPAGDTIETIRGGYQAAIERLGILGNCH